MYKLDQVNIANILFMLWSFEKNGEGKHLFCGGEENEEGKGGNYLEKENIFLCNREKGKGGQFYRRKIILRRKIKEKNI